jgi:hypothetical protein
VGVLPPGTREVAASARDRDAVRAAAPA